MNPLLQVAIPYWSKEEVFWARPWVFAPDEIEMAVSRALESDAGFAPALTEVAVTHRSPYVCANALVALVRARVPGWEELPPRFKDDRRTLSVRLGSFTMNKTLSQVAESITISPPKPLTEALRQMTYLAHRAPSPAQEKFLLKIRNQESQGNPS